MGVDVVEAAEELFLGVQVPRRAVAPDAHADGAGAAPLPLRLPDRVKQALAHAVQVAPRLAQVGQVRRQRVLDVLVLAPAALEEQLHLHLVVRLPLLEVDAGGPGAQVVAAVLARERVHRVGAQLPLLRGLGDGLADLAPHDKLVGADGRADLEGGPARVLADGPLVAGGHVDVGGDDLQRLGRARRLLGLHGARHGPPHVRRQVHRGLGDQLQHAVTESVHGVLPLQLAAACGPFEMEDDPNLPHPVGAPPRPSSLRVGRHPAGRRPWGRVRGAGLA